MHEEGVGHGSAGTSVAGTSARRPSLDSLTGLRFFAAMAVVLAHFAASGLVSIDTAVTDFLDGGRTAVSLFFVLSGFVLAYNYADLTGGVGRWNYYVARLARIYPVVLLALAVASVGMIYAWSRPDLLLEWYALPTPSPGAASASLAAQLTMTTGWFPFAAVNQPWNAAAWSISCEVFFYALFPLLIVGMRRLSRRSLLVVAIAAWLAQGLLIAALGQLPESRSGFLIAQLPLTHLAEFVLGIAACLIATGVPIRRAVRGVVLAGAVAALALLAYFEPVDPAFWPMSPVFAVLVIVLAARDSSRTVLAHPVVVLLGEASYSLYLLHLPLTYVYTAIGIPPGPAGWVAMAATILLSVGVYKWYETPLRRLIRRRAGRQPSAARTG